jgi:hypothetical protein
MPQQLEKTVLEMDKFLKDNKQKINWEEVGKLLHNSDETQDYQVYDALLEKLVEMNLLYPSKIKTRPFFALASPTSPHIAPISSNEELYYFKTVEDAYDFSEKVFKEDPLERNVFVLKYI